MGDQRSLIRSLLIIVAAASVLLFSSAAQAQRRVALVIGNGAYQKVPALPNPPNDAADVGASLERLGFSVKLLNNARFDDFRRALLEFGRNARAADMAIIFFAGHGMEVGGENWLIPTDAELRTDTDAENEAISLRTAMLQVAGASELGLVILDACRNNPFAARMQRTIRTRAVDRGLVRTEPTDNVLVAYAAKDGTTASDGAGRNSPFTAALLKSIETPGLEITFMFRNVRDEVMTATKREQQPFVYGSLSRHAIYLKLPPATPAVAAPVVEPTTPALPVVSEAAQAWANVKDTTSTALLESYMKRYSDSFFADLARSRLDELKPPTVKPATPPPVQEARLADPATPVPDEPTDCDRLAASPFDRQRHKAVPGVLFEKIDVVPALAACNEALRLYPNVTRIVMQAGRVAQAQKDFATARRHYERAVNMGSTVAFTGLGGLYLTGSGVTRDYDEGRRLMEKAVAAGEPNAMNALGIVYLNGMGVPKSDFEAKQWFEKAAAGGIANAMNNLGILAQNGRAGPKDEAEARRWFEKAAALGDANAMNNIGLLYANGIGVTQDDVEGRKWFTRGINAGGSNAMTSLAYMYQNGRGGQKDYAEARQLYEKASAAGDFSAMNNIGIMYLHGIGVTKNDTEARKWFEKGAKGENPGAMTSYGLMLQDGRGGPRDTAEARRLYEKAAAAGDGNAMANLGLMYINGVGVQKSDIEARKWIEKGAALGNPSAMTSYGLFLQFGRGGPRDYVEARKLYDKAAALGTPEALHNIGTMYQNGAGVRRDLAEARRWYEKAAAAGVEVSKKALRNLR